MSTRGSDPGPHAERLRRALADAIERAERLLARGHWEQSDRAELVMILADLEFVSGFMRSRGE